MSQAPSGEPTSTTSSEVDTIMLGMIGLRNGEVRLLQRRPGGTPTSARSSVDVVRDEATPSGGVVYTDIADMPALEDLLRANEVAVAILERPIPRIPVTPDERQEARSHLDGTEQTPTPRPKKALSWKLVVAAAIPAAFSSVGVTLFITSVANRSVHTNPYTALALALGGLVLLASLLSAIRS